MSAEERRESLLNAPALMFMTAVLLIAFWVLFPRQPAFRDPANLSAKDALSVAYLRVLVQSDPGNAPLRLSFVQLLTEAGMLDEAATAIEPLQNAPEFALTYEIRLADLRLALQQLYRRPESRVEESLRARIAELVPSLLRIARNDRELNQVVASAEQFGEPALLAETFEHLVAQKNEARDKKLRWLVFAGRQRMAANQPRLGARNFLKAFAMEQSGREKLELAKSSLRAYLQAGFDQEAQKEEALKGALQVHENVAADAELLLLEADIAQPLADHAHALAWLEEASQRLLGDQMLAERIVRLQISMGLLADSLSRVAQLRPGLVPGSDRHRLLAQIHDWNGQPDEALELWLSFARAKADPEAETRAFALARAKPDNRALVQLLESVMIRRTLTQAEADSYVKAALTIAPPGHAEQQLRQHAERFDNPAATMKALADVLILQGKPGAVLALREDLPEAENIQQRIDLARLYDEAGNAQKSFDLLLQDSGSPGQRHTEEYWLLLAKVSSRLGQDSYARRAYEKMLALRPGDVEILENLQRLAVRHRDEKESERLARYGWDRLGRVEDLQRLMQFSWKREDWAELDKWLALTDEMQSSKPSLVEQADTYWYFRAMRSMASGKREAAEQALRHVLQVRGPDPEITEAMIWLLLSGKKVDHAFLDAIVQPFRPQSGGRPALSPHLTEALAAAEQTLGKPLQAAEWYQQSLAARPRDFLWTLTLADNMEWAGCPSSANHVRFIALKLFASPNFKQAEVQHPLRLAEYFSGRRDVLAQRGTWVEPENGKWLSLRRNWNLSGNLDNADYFSLQRQTERLSSPAWQKFAGAAGGKNQAAAALQLKAISAYLEGQPDKKQKQTPEILPLSLDDVDREQRWLAGKSLASPGDLHAEADVCRQTLAKIRGSQQVFSAGEEQPAL